MTLAFTEEIPEVGDVVKVEVVNREEEAAPHFGEGTFISFAGTAADVPQVVLPQAPTRHRAVITVYGTGATIFLGSFTKVSNSQGYQLRSGTVGLSIVIESASAVWAMSDKATASVVTWWDERYQSKEGQGVESPGV